MYVTTGQLTRGLAVLGTGGVAAISALVLEGWLGDWVGPVWLLSPYVASFGAGLAWGREATGLRGMVVWALAGLTAVVVPSGIILLTFVGKDLGSEVSERDLPRLWLAFIPLGMAIGALSAPVGGAVRVDLQERRSRSIRSRRPSPPEER